MGAHQKRKKVDPENPRATKGPDDWDKAVSAAYLRLLGATQQDAGDAVGVHHDTVSRWEGSLWWPEALAEASGKWLAGLEAKAREVLHNGMDPAIALKILERRLPDLAPATQNVNLKTPDLPDRIVVETVRPDPAEE